MKVTAAMDAIIRSRISSSHDCFRSYTASLFCGDPSPTSRLLCRAAALYTLNFINSHSSRHVRFGSKADSCSPATHVRFTPHSDRESGHRENVMSALLPKADMCTALGHVC